MVKFKLEIELKNKNMQSCIHAAQALRELSDKFNYSCEEFPSGWIMDTKNEEPVGRYWVSMRD